MILRFIVRILANSVAIALAASFVFNFSFPYQDWGLLLTAGAILAVLNGVLKPVLKFFSAPLIWLSLGIFLLIINMAMLWLLKQIMPELMIEGFQAYLWGVIIISVINWLFDVFVKPRKKPAEAPQT